MKRFMRWCVVGAGVSMFVLHLAMFVAMAIWGYQPSNSFVAGWTSVACMQVAIQMIFDREPAE